ncbi:hypothetical protein AB0346_07860 [Nocardia beijingensis]|uniref:hypothetical protein n=1 Tax=Nocardia beijingensis TaxID=95162 RepID=UPI00344DF7E5
MPHRLTNDLTGLDLPEKMWPTVPDSDNAEEASELFAFAYENGQRLRMDLEMVLAMHAEDAPFMAKATLQLRNDIRMALLRFCLQLHR